MKEDQTPQQPWKSWYVANTAPEKTVNYVVPIMAAGNHAPASQKNGRLDLSKPKGMTGQKK